jgi:hypothetical protein
MRPTLEGFEEPPMRTWLNPAGVVITLSYLFSSLCLYFSAAFNPLTLLASKVLRSKCIRFLR